MWLLALLGGSLLTAGLIADVDEESTEAGDLEGQTFCEKIDQALDEWGWFLDDLSDD